MKILVVGRSFYPNIGGVESSLDYISHAFAEKGHSVSILTSLLNLQQKCEEKWDSGITIIRVPINKKGLQDVSLVQTAILPFYLLGQYKKYIKNMKEEYDLIICRDTAFAHILAKKYGKNKLIYIPAVLMKKYRWKIHLKSIRKMLGEILMYMQITSDWILQKKCLKRYRCAVFSENMKNQILKEVHIDNDIKVIYPGNKYSSSSESKQDKKDVCLLLYVGRVDTEKNVDLMLKAYSKCHNLKKSKLTIVGDGNRCNEMKKLAKQLNIDQYLYFAGKHSDVSTFYSEANYLILPTKYEAFGFVMAEAQTFGTPVIGFKNNGKDVLVAIDEIVQDNYNGFVCNTYSEESLTNTVDKAIDVYFSDEYNELRDNSKKVAEKNFKWSIFIDRLLSFHRDARMY